MSVAGMANPPSRKPSSEPRPSYRTDRSNLLNYNTILSEHPNNIRTDAGLKQLASKWVGFRGKMLGSEGKDRMLLPFVAAKQDHQYSESGASSSAGGAR
jgi:hypothetical protein